MRPPLLFTDADSVAFLAALDFTDSVSASCRTSTSFLLLGRVLKCAKSLA